MKKFLNLKKVLEAKGVSKTDIDVLLFPNVKFPDRALARILDGEAELSASQVATLSEFLGMSIDEMFEPDRFRWENTLDGKHVFIYGDTFRVEVSLDTWQTVIYFRDEIIKRDNTFTGNTPLSVFFDEIREEIHNWIDLS